MSPNSNYEIKGTLYAELPKCNNSSLKMLSHLALQVSDMKHTYFLYLSKPRLDMKLLDKISFVKYVLHHIESVCNTSFWVKDELYSVLFTQ